MDIQQQQQQLNVGKKLRGRGGVSGSEEEYDST
jgi:hypothetical protein